MWDYAISRAPVGLPKLQRTHSRTENLLRNLLKPVEDLQLPSESDSEGSEILDVFEELHRESFLRPLSGTKKKFLSKFEADCKTVARFTEDFKRTMEEVRKELEVGESLTVENESMVESALSGEEKIALFSPSQLTICEPISVDLEPLDLSETTSNSAIWNMIQANQRDRFSTSPPHYNLYEATPPDHYLRRPYVTWEEVEQSRKKCLQWLEKCDSPATKKSCVSTRQCARAESESEPLQRRPPWTGPRTAPARH